MDKFNGMIEVHLGMVFLRGWLEQIPAKTRVSEVVVSAARKYLEATGKDADAIVVRQIPKGASELMEMEGMTLFSTDWMVERSVLVYKIERLELING